MSVPVQTPTTLLLGRAREVAEIGALLSRDDVRLVNITGPGGIGKTRVAQEVASGVASTYGDVWWVSLAELGDPAMVLPAVGVAGGVVGDLGIALRATRPLVVLDSLEHLRGATDAILGVLAECPGVDVLVTSRVALRVSAEWRYPLAPLDEAHAVVLLRNRAQASGAGSALEDDEVAAICRRLDGLPLAIELAAARLRLLSPAALLDRLDDALTLLGGGPNDLPDRQRTLATTLAWSCDLLSPDQQRLFARLAVFAGGFTIEAAGAVLGANLDALDALVDHSLLGRHDDRFRMLAPVHEHATRLLAESGEARELEARHVEWYAAFADEAKQVLLECPEPEPVRSWLARFTAERHNLRAAIARALALGLHGPALSIVVPMWMCWETHGMFAEARRTLAAVVAAASPAELSGHPEALESLVALTSAAGDHDAAAALAADLARMSTALSYRGSLWIAEVAWGRGELAEAEALYRKAEADAVEVGHVCYEVCARARLVAAALRRGDGEQARRLTDRLRTAGIGIDHFYVRTGALQLIGWAELACGQPLQARTPLLESARLLARTGWIGFPWRPFAGLACTWDRTDPVRAARLAGFAEAIAERSGERVLDAEAELIAPFLGLRARLGDILDTEVWDAARASGAGLSFDEALAVARGEGSASDAGVGVSNGYDVGDASLLRTRFDLTPRELDVLRLIAAGLSNRAISAALVISPKTTSIHVSHILAKLRVSSRVQAALLARQIGLDAPVQHLSSA